MNHDHRRPRVLIADHDDVMLIGVAELLRRRGFTVDATHRLEISSESEPFDVIIFDPLVDGDLSAARDFVTSVRQSAPAPSMIVVSEFIESLDELDLREGHSALLHGKPVRVAALTESVERLLRDRRKHELPLTVKDSA